MSVHPARGRAADPERAETNRLVREAANAAIAKAGLTNPGIRARQSSSPASERVPLDLSRSDFDGLRALVMDTTGMVRVLDEAVRPDLAERVCKVRRLRESYRELALASDDRGERQWITSKVAALDDALDILDGRE